MINMDGCSSMHDVQYYNFFYICYNIVTETEKSENLILIMSVWEERVVKWIAADTRNSNWLYKSVIYVFIIGAAARKPIYRAVSGSGSVNSEILLIQKSS